MFRELQTLNPSFRRTFDQDLKNRFDLVILEQSQLELCIGRFRLEPEQRRLFLSSHANFVRSKHVKGDRGIAGAA